MSTILRCLNSSAKLREELRSGADSVTLTLQDATGTVVDIAVTLRAMRQRFDGREDVVLVMPDGHFITVTLAVPTARNADVEVLHPGDVIDLINSDGPDWITLALEQYLRWQENVILWGIPGPAPDGPYAQHPVLHALPVTVRSDLADMVWAGRRIVAIKTLRRNLPGLGLKDAKIFLDALEHFC